ncbi:hypothetical protein BHM03_00057590 [Ensete ventricosum]|nr:hypothetical protein BHM03_00057590 [Ensete ventricosum]
MGSRTSMVPQKNFARSRAQSRVSIGFSYTISEISNFGHSRLISPWEVGQAQFHENTRRS